MEEIHLEASETYREFVRRYRTILQIYRIRDDEHHVLGYLSNAFEEQLVYLVLFGMQLGYSVRDGFTSISQFLNCLELVPGPFNQRASCNQCRCGDNNDGIASTQRMPTPQTSYPRRYSPVRRGGHYNDDTTE